MAFSQYLLSLLGTYLMSDCSLQLSGLSDVFTFLCVWHNTGTVVWSGVGFRPILIHNVGHRLIQLYAGTLSDWCNHSEAEVWFSGTLTSRGWYFSAWLLPWSARYPCLSLTLHRLCHLFTTGYLTLFELCQAGFSFALRLPPWRVCLLSRVYLSRHALDSIVFSLQCLSDGYHYLLNITVVLFVGLVFPTKFKDSNWSLTVTGDHYGVNMTSCSLFKDAFKANFVATSSPRRMETNLETGCLSSVVSPFGWIIQWHVSWHSPWGFQLLLSHVLPVLSSLIWRSPSWISILVSFLKAVDIPGR